MIRNTGIGRSWKHTPLIILSLRKPKWRQWTCWRGLGQVIMALSTHSRLFAQAFTFSSIERLFPSHRGVPAPFTQEECQELMILIRSFGGTYRTFFFCNKYTYIWDDRWPWWPRNSNTGGSPRSWSVYFYLLSFWLCNSLTAINALAKRRQSCFRHKKPLPTNISSNYSSLPMAPPQLSKWVIIDFLISCLFLCIPYIPIGRTCLSTRTIDEESGFRSVTPTLVIGACTCFVVRPWYSPYLANRPFSWS